MANKGCILISIIIICFLTFVLVWKAIVGNTFLQCFTRSQSSCMHMPLLLPGKHKHQSQKKMENLNQLYYAKRSNHMEMHKEALLNARNTIILVAV
ncbi:hypothetical protein HN51_023409 [Arachis hypogaea]